MLYYFNGSVTLNKNARAHTRTHKSYSRVTHSDFFLEAVMKEWNCSFLTALYDACFSCNDTYLISLLQADTKLVECKDYNTELYLSLN